MRFPFWWWRKVRKADIPKTDRDTFGRFGEIAIASIIAGGCSPPSELADIYTNAVKHEHARAWLIERGDVHERRERLQVALECAVLIFVVLGVIVGTLELFHVDVRQPLHH